MILAEFWKYKEWLEMKKKKEDKEIYHSRFIIATRDHWYHLHIPLPLCLTRRNNVTNNDMILSSLEFSLFALVRSITPSPSQLMFPEVVCGWVKDPQMINLPLRHQTTNQSFQV